MSQGIQEALKAEKVKEMDSPLEPPERDTTLLPP